MEILVTITFQNNNKPLRLKKILKENNKLKDK